MLSRLLLLVAIVLFSYYFGHSSGFKKALKAAPEKYKLVVVISPTFKYSKQSPGMIIDNDSQIARKSVQSSRK